MRKRQIEVLLHPGRGFGQRLPRRGGVGAGTAKLAPSPPNTNGKFAARQRVGDGDDHRGAGHVHGLVAVLGDRLGRLHDVGDADHPVVRQRREQAGSITGVKSRNSGRLA